MKMSKRIAAGVLTAAMAVSVVAMPMTALAYNVTINDQISPVDAEHTYSAYQIFKGQLTAMGTNEPSVLTEIDWGSSIKDPSETPAYDYSAELLAALQEDELFASCTTLEKTLEKLQTLGEDSLEMQKFADIVRTLLIEKGATPEKTNSGSAIENLEGGYYLIDDTANVQDKTDAISRCILGVFEDLSVTVKKDVPTLDKKIDETPLVDGDGVDVNTARIGDTVPYVLSSILPDMAGYDKYFFVFDDTLSKGLTYNDGSVSVYIDGTELPESAYTVTANEDENGITALRIVLNNFVQYDYLNYEENEEGAYYKLVDGGFTTTEPQTVVDEETEVETLDARYQTVDGAYVKYSKKTENVPIRVAYSAMLNEDADYTSNGNLNTAQLTFSNNPNYEYEGENEPTENDKEMTGETPKKQNKTFTTALQLEKIDGKTELPLSGATFQIVGEGVTAVYTDGTYFVEKSDAEPAYYMLNDNTFTDVAPEDAPDVTVYASTTTTYEKITGTYPPHVSSIAVDDTQTTGEEGLATFIGLNDGEYTITELEAPTGYNKLKEPFRIEITSEFVALEGTYVPMWHVTKYEGDEEEGEVLQMKDFTSIFYFQVENNKGITLPGTGGAGTVMFYVVGTLMMTGSAVMFVKSNKKKDEEK